MPQGLRRGAYHFSLRLEEGIGWKMSLGCSLGCGFSGSGLRGEVKLQAPPSVIGSGVLGVTGKNRDMIRFSWRSGCTVDVSKVLTTSILKAKAFEGAAEVVFDNAKAQEEVHQSDDDSEESPSFSSEDEDDLFDMTDEDRWEFRRKIREVIDMNPNFEEEMDPVGRQKKMEKLLADYPLVVDEEDPDWPEDADGRGFNLDQFFNKISIKNVRKDDDDNYDSDKELVWQDDDYIHAVKDITSKEWEETVFKDISPLVILVHNRYKRPMINEQFRKELVEGVQIFWDSRLPSPRCVAIDAVVDTELASALKVSIFPELIFTKAGKILYREKAIRSADELSRIMAFFYYGANQPSWFVYNSNCSQELIPSFP